MVWAMALGCRFPWMDSREIELRKYHLAHKLDARSPTLPRAICFDSSHFPVEHKEHVNIWSACSSLPAPNRPWYFWISFGPFSFLEWVFHPPQATDQCLYIFSFFPNNFYSFSSSVTASWDYWIIEWRWACSWISTKEKVVCESMTISSIF